MAGGGGVMPWSLGTDLLANSNDKKIDRLKTIEK